MQSYVRLKKNRGVGWVNQKKKYFCIFVTYNGLFDIQFKLGNFTWTNRRSGFLNIAEKLDRFFFVDNWDKFHWTVQAEMLPIIGSNHYPISVRIQEDVVLDRCPFKFEKMWLRAEVFWI